MIYMDNSATSPVKEEVFNAMIPYLKEEFGNPSTFYKLGRNAKKAVEAARNNLVKVDLVGTTIPHEIIGEYGAGKVVLRPASEGTGVIAGGAVRAVLELAGVGDILTKCLGSRTPINMVRATVDGLTQLKTLNKEGSYEKNNNCK